MMNEPHLQDHQLTAVLATHSCHHRQMMSHPQNKNQAHSVSYPFWTSSQLVVPAVSRSLRRRAVVVVAAEAT